MRYDVVAQGVVEPLVALMLGQIEFAFSTLQRLISDMSLSELEYQGPDGSLNSTATLVMHLAVVDLWWLYRMQGRRVPPEVRSRYGPPQDGNRLPAIRGCAAEELLSLYGEVQESVAAYLRTMPDAELGRVVSLGEHEATVRWALWHMAEHSVLHQGHIRWLKSWARDQPLGG